MGIITTAVFESFNMDEDFQDEILDSAERSLEKAKDENIDESLNEAVSIWDKIEKYLDLDESLITESSDIESAIDKYQALLRKDIPPEKAKAIVVGKEPEEIKESLEEPKELSKKDKINNRNKDSLKKYVEAYRKAAKFSLDEDLTEDKLKYEDWRIKNFAMRAAIPSSDFKEALLKGNKNEN